ncbi:hypothetical protein Fmac_029678 [Flemingia macrophylla]|uniref:Uncharacterized protein n=1 Tax=Flemingia macrophylla TaxID=520843 RepID=A0ABD1LB03_9FABA
MANWRKQQGQSHNHVGQWRSSSNNRKPPLGQGRVVIEALGFVSLSMKVTKSLNILWDGLLRLSAAVISFVDSLKLEAKLSMVWKFSSGCLNIESCSHIVNKTSSYQIGDVWGNWQSTVPAWEKRFCSSVGLIPWKKLIESKRYMHLFQHIVNWDDTAGKEAFDNAKARYWAEINGLQCNLSFPDPDMYIDNVNWEASIDPALYEDLESEAKVPVEEVVNEVVLLGGNLFVNEQIIPPTGWGDDEAEAPKPFDQNAACQVWQSNLHESNAVAEFGPQQCYSPVDYAKEYEWQNCRNDPWRGNRREYYGRGRHGGDGNLGGTWEGYNRRRENMSWSNNSYNGNEYHHVNRGRRNSRGGGGRRGNFVYVPKEVPSPAAM